MQLVMNEFMLLGGPSVDGWPECHQHSQEATAVVGVGGLCASLSGLSVVMQPFLGSVSLKLAGFLALGLFRLHSLEPGSGPLGRSGHMA